MIIKSKEAKYHAKDLRSTFFTFRAQIMRLYLDKIQAILNMQSPRSVKEVQKLTGCMAASGRSMSEFADRCLPFFKTLKKPCFEGNLKAEEVFQQLKKYLANLSQLVSLVAWEVLFLYVAIPEYFLSVVLVVEREGKKFPIYYISHTYRGSESNYSEIEKVLYAVVMAGRKLKPYFSHFRFESEEANPSKRSWKGRINPPRWLIGPTSWQILVSKLNHTLPSKLKHLHILLLKRREPLQMISTNNGNFMWMAHPPDSLVEGASSLFVSWSKDGTCRTL